MSNITVVHTDDGSEIELYQHRIFEIFDEYVESVNADKMSPSIFTGGIKAVYRALFEPHEPQMYNKNTVLDTSNIDLLNQLWQVYTELCYRSQIKPTLLRFSFMTGISMDTFNSWDRGEYRATQRHSEIYKKWRQECESALVDAVIENSNIGSMFILKSVYQYREASPIQPELPRTEPHASLAEIRERHKDATLPEPIDFSDVDFDDEED